MRVGKNLICRELYTPLLKVGPLAGGVAGVGEDEGHDLLI